MPLTGGNSGGDEGFPQSVGARSSAIRHSSVGDAGQFQRGGGLSQFAGVGEAPTSGRPQGYGGLASKRHDTTEFAIGLGGSSVAPPEVQFSAELLKLASGSAFLFRGLVDMCRNLFDSRPDFRKTTPALVEVAPSLGETIRRTISQIRPAQMGSERYYTKAHSRPNVTPVGCPVHS